MVEHIISLQLLISIEKVQFDSMSICDDFQDHIIFIISNCYKNLSQSGTTYSKDIANQIKD